ncbi:MAG: PilZ domain-containing protein [Candidatus Sulfotelmatobacter sp.]|jgi:hypothetical protein
MTTPPVGVERRIGQRFAFNLPVSLRDIATSSEGLGFTQDLSSRGAFLFTDMALSEGAEIELTLEMPSEITLGDNMRVRCRGSVLRIVKPMDKDRNDRNRDRDRNNSSSSDNGWKPAALAETETNLSEIKPESKIGESKIAESKIGVAVCLKGYEYLPETESGSPDFRRISALHSPSETQRPAAPVPGTPRVAAS